MSKVANGPVIHRVRHVVSGGTSIDRSFCFGNEETVILVSNRVKDHTSNP